MVEVAEAELAELVAREQRGFRSILMAGIIILIVLVVMSAIMGIFYFRVSQDLKMASRDLKRNVFEMRQAISDQNTRLSEQEARIRRTADEIRDVAGRSSGPPTARQIASVRLALNEYIQKGRHLTVGEEVIVSRVASAESGRPIGALMAGISGLIQYGASGDKVPPSGELPPQLQDVLTKLEVAQKDRAYAPNALTAIASVRYQIAQARNYAIDSCAAVFDAIAAAEAAGASGPPLLAWRAQCERKTGRTREAFVHYAAVLRATGMDRAPWDKFQPGAPGAPPISTFQIDALHGVGTTLIRGALKRAPDDALNEALATTNKVCAAGPTLPEQSEPMRLALACLDRAMLLRRAAGQPLQQINGSAENKSFAYLRDHDFQEAFANAETIAPNSLYAWNELVRVITSTNLIKMGDTSLRAKAKRVRAAALDNVAFFGIERFNVCELRSLLDDDLYTEAMGILARTHPDKTLAEIECAKK